MRTIRASEIGSFIFCNRAWWYQRQDVESENAAELTAGTEIHQQHGRQVVTAGCMRTLAMGLLLASLVAVVLHFMTQALR
jgi:hypothetical protein